MILTMNACLTDSKNEIIKILTVEMTKCENFVENVEINITVTARYTCTVVD